MEYGLSLGSNIGSRRESLELAAEKICELNKVSILQESSRYETEPIDVSEEYQAKHINPRTMALTMIFESMLF